MKNNEIRKVINKILNEMDNYSLHGLYNATTSTTEEGKTTADQKAASSSAGNAEEEAVEEG